MVKCCFLVNLPFFFIHTFISFVNLLRCCQVILLKFSLFLTFFYIYTYFIVISLILMGVHVRIMLAESFVFLHFFMEGWRFMLGFFNEDNFLYIFLMKVWDIVLMNLLFILCCIPIVTIGPSFSAMYTCTLKMRKGNHIGTLKTFFRAFKQNFKQSFIVWIGTLVVSFILWTN